MQDLVRSYGWPDDFKRDECKEALAEWEKHWLKRQ